MMNGVFPNLRSYGQQWFHILEDFSHLKGKYSSGIEDERKLFYVAVTRAKKNLFLLYEFSKKDLSDFVREASEASILQINKADLLFERKKTKSKISYSTVSYGDEMQHEENKQNNMVSDEEYAYIIRTLRRQIKEYYGSAMGVNFAMAAAELERIDSMSDEEIQSEAVRLGLAQWR
jgi:ATP-dependent exoDNAse (exonuclease V) beta subunit